MFTGAIHSPFKQPVGRRLVYGWERRRPSRFRRTNNRRRVIVINIGGLGPKGIVAGIDALGYDLLGVCNPAPNVNCTECRPSRAGGGLLSPA